MWMALKVIRYVIKSAGKEIGQKMGHQLWIAPFINCASYVDGPYGQ